ncbi:hypothetical protein BDC45DRAFT_571236 [Circinella umbellata]|nr:hypothetical protein BDC45DRAFT_571236 [Circinella umbellata]
MVEDREVFIPTMEVHSSSHPQNKTREDPDSSFSNTLLDDATLVLNGEQVNTEEPSNIFQDQKMVDERLARISKARTSEDLRLDEAKYLNKSTRDSTQKN